MIVYVAGRHVGRVRHCQRALERFGHEVSFDWTQYPPKTRTLTLARKLRRGVRDADALVLWEYDPAMLGAMIEVGIAVEREMLIVLGGERTRESTFWSLPNVERAITTDDVLMILGAHEHDLRRHRLSPYS